MTASDPLHADRPAAPQPPGVELGHLTPQVDGSLQASFGGAAPVPVRAVVGLDPSALATGCAVLAVRVVGEMDPIIIGVLDTPGVERLARTVDFAPPPPTGEKHAHVEPPSPERPPSAPASAAPASDPVHVVADGRRVTVEAADEIVLRCGEASLTLRADGRVVVRGTHILSQSSGPHRLKGGSFSIN